MESTEMLLNLTATAVSKIQSFIEEQGASDGAGLRVAVLPGGCSGFQYGLNIEDAPESDDEVFDLSGVKIFVDPFSVQYLSGVEIDYVTSMMGSGFTFSNPNASGGCGCGSSFTA
jgi:iron-sulfur cluster assembly protein